MKMGDVDDSQLKWPLLEEVFDVVSAYRDHSLHGELTRQ